MNDDDMDPTYDALMRARPGEYGAGPEGSCRPSYGAQDGTNEPRVVVLASTELFFPERGESSAEAKAICSSCLVVDTCRDAGEGQLGVWGGTSGLDRRRDRAAA